MLTMHVRVWFDGVPIIEIGPLTAEILSRGWEHRQSFAGEWWCEFRRTFDSEAAFEQELEALKALFGTGWTRFGMRTASRVDFLAD